MSLVELGYLFFYFSYFYVHSKTLSADITRTGPEKRWLYIKASYPQGLFLHEGEERGGRFLYGVGGYALCKVLNVAWFVTCNFLVPCKYVVSPGPTHKALEYMQG